MTAACERIVQPENSHMGMVTLLKEFMDLLNVMTTDHEGSKRNIPGMPESFKEPSPRFMNLDGEPSPVNPTTHKNRLPLLLWTAKAYML